MSIRVAEIQFLHAQTLYEQARKVRDAARKRLKQLTSNPNHKP